ncbi:sulfite reductase subunit alpha [Tahibacter amnicola]|uniref:NADPH--hemoprotein reductase n=1 Tax=Tahibacter amnicola TaxID=2976241 RepID=A0ABY6BAS1_9GAMM|nr:sulfite reductase subunit alpha [Tahibacter amnicola]UXI67161.1 sulfite reductase subunit alpha [Tahibacter amnicola]
MTVSRKERRSTGALAGYAVLALLAAIAVALLWLQREPILWRGVEPARGAAIVALIAAWAAWSVWLRAAGSATKPGGQLAVVYATQTGTAEQIARQTAERFRQAGTDAPVVSLAAVDAAFLARYSTVYFVVSTYGEGEPPDMGDRFRRRVMSQALALHGLRYGVLALGDRHYAQFCAFGRQLDAWLAGQGATRLFDCLQVDDADTSVLSQWQQQLHGDTASDSPTPNRSDDPWRLVSRECLNPAGVGAPCFRIVLAPPPGMTPDWQAGDIAQVLPQRPADEVAAWLRDHLPATATPSQRASWEHVLATAELPSPAPAFDLLPDASTLPRFMHRDYSIASLPSDGALELVVRQMRGEDGRMGVASGWLTAHAAVGDTVLLRLRRNTNFHLPVGGPPLILIGNGTGIAGLRALLKARQTAGIRRNWLLYGERSRRTDYPFGDELQGWLADGWLDRLDLAFSRDGQSPVYVQDRLGEASATLTRWVSEGAAIYVCGSLHGMAPAVDARLRAILGEASVDNLIAEGRYRRDVY